MDTCSSRPADLERPTDGWRLPGALLLLHAACCASSDCCRLGRCLPGLAADGRELGAASDSLRTRVHEARRTRERTSRGSSTAPAATAACAAAAPECVDVDEAVDGLQHLAGCVALCIDHSIRLRLVNRDVSPLRAVDRAPLSACAAAAREASPMHALQPPTHPEQLLQQHPVGTLALNADAVVKGVQRDVGRVVAGKDLRKQEAV